MAWSDKDEASKVHKYLKAGLLYPEDLKANEIRVLRQHRPSVYHKVKSWLEFREQRIENGEWCEDSDPPDTDRRINRLDRGESVVDPYTEQDDAT